MKYEALLSRRKNARGDFALASGVRHYAPDLKLEPIHTDLYLTIDLEQKTAEGYALVRMKANVAGTHSIALDAVDFEDLDVRSTGKRSFSHSYNDKQIKIHFDQAFEKGEETVVRIAYKVIEPISGIGFNKPDAQRPDMPLSAISDNETERARYWFPCVDFPTVRSRMEYHLTARKELTILANGALVSEEIHGDLKTAHWKLDYPCPSYLACFGIGEFSEFVDEPLDGMPIAYYADRSYTPEQLHRTFAPTRKMLSWMQQKLGMKFPFPKYYQLAGREVGGAMENISLVTWDDKFMLDETMAKEWQYIMDLINVHEMSHSYFGDAVVSYDFAHVWLKESWATYIESVWLEDSAGKDAMDWQLAEEAASYMGEAKNRYVRPIITREYDHSWNMFDMHLYPGGAWRLHMLRHLVGDTAFWAGVQDYVNGFAGKTVKSIDFQRCIENHSAHNLDNFFDTWFHSKGYPILAVDFSFDKEKGLGKFTLEQKQIDKDKDIPAFEMPLEILWQDAQGQDHLETIQLNKAVQVIQLNMTEPAHVALDPNMKALFEADFNPGDEKLRHLLQHGKTVRSKMQAISELAKTGKRKNLQSICDYLITEKQWGLRIHTYRELGTVGNEYAFQHLSELLLSEQDPMVLEAAATACGKHAHESLRQAILKKLKEKKLPYRGQMALLEALGKQKKETDITRLHEYAKQSGWRDLVKAGAYLGLGATHSEAAVDALLEDFQNPVHFYDPKVARMVALNDIRQWLPKHLQKRVDQALCDATRDPSYFVRINAARNLGSAQISAGIPALTALLPRLPDQDHPLIKRQIKAIQAGGEKSADKKLQKQIDELQEKLAGMEKRLQEVESEK